MSGLKRITKEQREEILRLWVEGDIEASKALAATLRLRPEYAYRLARERGVIPYMRRGHEGLLGRTHLGAIATSYANPTFHDVAISQNAASSEGPSALGGMT